jgi:hypothetical protein
MHFGFAIAIQKQDLGKKGNALLRLSQKQKYHLG